MVGNDGMDTLNHDGVAPVDRQRDPVLISRLRGIADEILAGYGYDFSAARRSGGWTNATWVVAGKVALRLATASGRDNLHREAQVARLLPAEVGYPEVIATGVTGGHEWMLAKAVEGVNLGEYWPKLSWPERVQAVRQLWARTRAVHTVTAEKARAIVRPQPFFNGSPTEGVDALAFAAARNIFSPTEAKILAEGMEWFWQVRGKAQEVLVHGDLTTENALWSPERGEVASLLDFEYAVVAPVEMDLNELLKIGFVSLDGPDPQPDPTGAGLRLLQDTVLELAAPVIDHPGGPDLLRGYAILLELWLLRTWLEHPDGEGPLETWGPYRTLRGIVDGRAYFQPAIDLVKGR